MKGILGNVEGAADIERREREREREKEREM